MKYLLQPLQAQFNEQQIATSEGWALVFNTDAVSGEFKHADYEYFPVGVGLPAFAYLDKPQATDNEHAIIRTASGWHYPPDHRGKTMYAIDSGEAFIIQQVGEIPTGYTLLKPTSSFDSWDGQQWCFDTNKQQAYHRQQAKQQHKSLLILADNTITHLQDA